MKKSTDLKSEFKSYLMSKGYEVIRHSILINEDSIEALVKGHNVNLNDFSEIQKAGEDTIVVLRKKGPFTM